jgi:hypothetical protein
LKKRSRDLLLAYAAIVLGCDNDVAAAKNSGIPSEK